MNIPNELKRIVCAILFMVNAILAIAQNSLPEYSAVGFFEAENSGRKAHY